MRKFLATIFATGTLAVGATAPVIPNGEMEFVQAVQYDVASLQQINIIATSTASQIALDKQKEFAAEIAALDRDKNGIVSMATFKDTTGELYEVQIPDALYRQMGERDGFSRNPKKTEYQSVFRSLVPKKANAAIAFDNSTQANTSGTPSSLTFAHTVSGSNRILFVYIYWNQSRTVSSVTYNGVGMTAVGSDNDNGGGERSNIDYLVAPATGANNVVITMSGATSIEAVAASYTGALQTSPIDASRYEPAALENTSSYSEALTTTTDNSWVIWGTRNYSGVVVSAGANTALREQVLVIYGALFGDSNAAVTPAGSRTLTLTSVSASNFFSDVLVSFKPAAEPEATEDIIWFSF